MIAFENCPVFMIFFLFYVFCKIFRVSRLKNQKPEKTRELMPAKVSALKVGPVCHNWGCAVKRYVGGLEISGFSTAHAQANVCSIYFLNSVTFWTVSIAYASEYKTKTGRQIWSEYRKKWHLCWLVTSLPIYLKSISVRTDHKWVKKMEIELWRKDCKLYLPRTEFHFFEMWNFEIILWSRFWYKDYNSKIFTISSYIDWKDKD